MKKTFMSMVETVVSALHERSLAFTSEDVCGDEQQDNEIHGHFVVVDIDKARGIRTVFLKVARWEGGRELDSILMDTLGLPNESIDDVGDGSALTRWTFGKVDVDVYVGPERHEIYIVK